MQRSFHLLRHAAAHHEVHLLALHQPRLLPMAMDLATSVDALSRLCASVRVIPIPAERSAYHRFLAAAWSIASNAPFDVTWLHSSAMEVAVTRSLDAGGIDLVHVDTVGLWPYVSRSTCCPIVLGHHNIESGLISQRAALERSAWRAALRRHDAAKLRALEDHASTRAAVNLVVSRLDADRLGTVAPGAVVEVVENGVDTDYWQPTDDPGHGIVFVGTLGWHPNRDAVEFLLSEVWPVLSANNQDRRLFIVGRDPPAAARAAAGDPRVQVTGFVPDVRPYLRAASIFVCPIRIGGGTRLKVLDALAMGKPLVATALAVEGLELTEGEHYLRAETAMEFVTQIERLEQHPELRRALGAAGRRRVTDRHDWRVIGHQLDMAYARAVAAPVVRPRASA